MKNIKPSKSFLGLCLILGALTTAFAEDAEIKLNSIDGATKLVIQDKTVKTVISFDSAGNMVTLGTATITGSEFSVGGSTFVIKSGNVGIGTTGPAARLDVAGTANMTTLSIGGTAIIATAAELNFINGVTSAIQTQFAAKANLASPAFTGNVTMPGTGIWNSSGNVGIGTTAPGYKLEVAGNLGIKANGTNTGELRVGYTATAPAGYYAVFAP